MQTSLACIEQLREATGANVLMFGSGHDLAATKGKGSEENTHYCFLKYVNYLIYKFTFS
jgi:hypothetical protein